MALGTNLEGKKIVGKIDELDFIDVNRVFSHRVAQKVAGQGVTVKSDKEEVQNFLNDFLKLNKFDDLLAQMVEEMSYWGRIVMTLDKTKTGNFLVSYATPELLQEVGKIEVNEFYAKLIKRKVVGMRVFFITEIWTTTEVNRSLTTINSVGQTVKYDQAEYGEVPEDLQFKAREVHNLGFVPIIDGTNKPNRNLVTGGMGVGSSYVMSDEYPVRHMSIHINHGLRQMYKEEVLGKSRVIGTLKPGTINKAGDNDILLQDGYIQAQATGENSKPIETMPGTYDGMKWAEPTKFKLNLYAKGRGQSEFFATENAQTEAETLYSKDNDQATAKYKRRRLTEMLNSLFSKLLVYKGLMTSLDEELPFSLEIKELVVYNQLQMGDFLANAVANRQMTQLEAIMTMRDLDDEEQAEEILKEINEEADARDEKDMQMLQAASGDAGEGVGKAGSGKDPDTDKEA